jgi:hypothetical protein
MNAAMTFKWEEELEKTVIHALTTSFGLDFLLFEDKKGGDVNTIHNVRDGIWATDKERQRYEEKGEYDSNVYHNDPNYIARGCADKKIQPEGKLEDYARSRKMGPNEPRELDHVQSAKEIHDDAGRVLAELDGVKLANADSNLAATHKSINASKQADSVDDFLKRLETSVPQFETDLQKKRERLTAMPRNTPEEQHKARMLEDDIRKDENKINTLKSIDKKAMRKKDSEARKAYNRAVNRAYYTSSKFLKSTANAAALSSVKMGTRQMLGLVMAEVWFELRAQLPDLLDRLKTGFDVEKFLDALLRTLKGIWARVSNRFEDFITKFREGALAGALSSLTTTLFNIFFTTQKIAIKLIREMWSNLVQAIKILVFNPDDLDTADLMKAVSNILALGVSTVLGSLLYGELVPLLTFPFGAELAAFASALTTGLLTLCLQYFINYSAMMQTVWKFIKTLNHAIVLEKFREINAKLDEHLSELARIEFGFDDWELRDLSVALALQNSELEKNILLRQATKKRGIMLPFDGTPESTREWLISKVEK